MNIYDAIALKANDRLMRRTHVRDGDWLQVVKVVHRGVIVDHYYKGNNHGHRELLDWNWLCADHDTNPVIKL